MEGHLKTRSSLYYSFENPTIYMIDLEDIVYSIAKEQRFTNQLKVDWTVLQHSLLVLEIVEELQGDIIDKYQALHHDDFEAYGRDIPTTLKKLLPNYKIIENKGLKAIGDYFGISLHPKTKLVQQADEIALNAEDILFCEPPRINPDFDENIISKMGIDKIIEDLQKTSRKDLIKKYQENHQMLSIKYHAAKAMEAIA